MDPYLLGDWIDTQWRDIWDAVTYSGLATWDDWIDLGAPGS